MKTLLILTLLGALAGIVVASLVVPPALSWYAEPGGLPHGTQIQAIVQIPEVIRYATTKLMHGQAIGGVLGALAGLALGVAMTRRKRLPAAPAAAPPATASSGAR